MPIRKNADGTATVVRTGVTDGPGDGGGTPINKAPLAKSNTKSPNFLPKSQSVTPRKQR
jgi:hypothetical protein